MIYENVILGLAARVRPKRNLLVPRGVQFYGKIFVWGKQKAFHSNGHYSMICCVGCAHRCLLCPNSRIPPPFESRIKPCSCTPLPLSHFFFSFVYNFSSNGSNHLYLNILQKLFRSFETQKNAMKILPTDLNT